MLLSMVVTEPIRTRDLDGSEIDYRYLIDHYSVLPEEFREYDEPEITASVPEITTNAPAGNHQSLNETRPIRTTKSCYDNCVQKCGGKPPRGNLN